MTERHYYSYLWLRDDGSPYYAGKGFGSRAYRQGSHYVPCPSDRARILVFPMLNEAEAFESEVALIGLFGRKDLGTGCLRNLTDGGDGISGHQLSPAAKRKIAEAHLGKHCSPATEFRVGQQSPRKGKRGKPLSAEHRAKLSVAQKGHPSRTTKEGIEKMRRAKIGSRASAETKARMRTSQIVAWERRRQQCL